MMSYLVLSCFFQLQIPCIAEGWEGIQGNNLVFNLFPASLSVCFQPLVVMAP